MRYFSSLAAAVIVVLCVGGAAGGDEITTGSLIAEVADLERLSTTPDVFYRTLQFSSHDRRANMPGGPDWFSNSDGFGGAPIPPFEKVLREPGDDRVGEYLLADVEGPGAIVRTWTAAINGHIQVYLDDEDEPVFDGPAEQFMHRPYEPFVAGSGLDAKSFNGTLYQRDAAYCAFPFAKRCRIIWKGDQRQLHFYYVQVRKYTGDAEVRTFREDDLKTYADQIERATAILADPELAVEELDDLEETEIDAEIAAGERSEALRLEGPAAIRRLALLVRADDVPAALRQTIMHISCDGWTAPQVQGPVGDFFGVAPGVNPYESLPFTVAGDGQMTARLPMPFKSSLVIEFENLGDQPVRITGKAAAEERPWNDDRSMHFYARWRATHGITTAPPVDIPFLLANGCGRYVGSVSLLMNPARGTHPSGSWWGEGDEKVFVDEDRRPIWFGTGSEDYYGYAWSATDVFYFPHVGQPRNDGPANRGFVTNYRFHTVDDLPFENRVSFYMELLAHHRVEGFSYACQSYYYGRPGIMDDHRVITREAVPRPELPAEWSPLAYRGSEGGAFFEPETITSTELKTEPGGLWSEGRLSAWAPAKEGDALELKFPVEKAGKYEVMLSLAHERRAGRVKATLDGKPFGFGGDKGELDLYDPYRTMNRTTDVNAVELDEGEHVLKLTYVGGAKEEPVIGVDFLWLQPR